MKICFITTSSIATNPRLVKEVLVAQDVFFDIEIICFRIGGWSDELDDKIKLQFKKSVTVVQLDASARSRVSWLFSSVSEKMAQVFSSVFKNFLPLAAVASNKRSLLLLYYIRKYNLLQDASLLVAHNLGALYPTFFYAGKYKIPFAFDVEDYHPCEVIGPEAISERQRRELLMKSMLPKAAYVSAASPLIGQEVEKLCRVGVTTINNSFFSTEFSLERVTKNPDLVQLVWFSQNISYNRGLEVLLPALDAYRSKIKLVLIGNLNQKFFQEWLQGREFVQVFAPMEQEGLHKQLSMYDIGLALELNSADYNREIALTNKIFAYKQAGLYILATNTKAQQLFMENFKGDGWICSQDVEGMKEGIRHIIVNIVSIRDSKEKRFTSSRSLAYEQEAQKLQKLWDETLKLI